MKIQSRKLALLSASAVMAVSLFAGAAEAKTKGASVAVPKTENAALPKLTLTASMKETLKNLEAQWPEMKQWKLKSSYKTDSSGFLKYDTGTKGRNVTIVVDLQTGRLKSTSLKKTQDPSWSSEKAPAEATAKKEATAFLKAVYGKDAEAYRLNPKVKSVKTVSAYDKEGKPIKYIAFANVTYHRVVNGKEDANDIISISVDQHGEVIDFAHTILTPGDK